MKTIFYLDGKKTIRKAIKERVGEERLAKILICSLMFSKKLY